MIRYPSIECRKASSFLCRSFALSKFNSIFFSFHHVRLSRPSHREEGDQGPTPGRRRHKIRHPPDQEGQHDVPQAAHEELQHDAEMAAEGDLQLRVSDVPQHHSR